MASARRPVELTLERSIPGAGGAPPVTLRFTMTLEGAELDSPRWEALQEEVGRWKADLDRLAESLQPAGSVLVRPDRPLAELVETYRPRQPELLDLLRDEGELTPGEYELLRRSLEPTVRAAPAGIPITDRPIAAAPIEADRAPAKPRPVEELLRLYQISTLRQAGAVRARRQISFDEYMALKRHFGPSPSP